MALDTGGTDGGGVIGATPFVREDDDAITVSFTGTDGDDHEDDGDDEQDGQWRAREKSLVHDSPASSASSAGAPRQSRLRISNTTYGVAPPCSRVTTPSRRTPPILCMARRER